MNWDVMLPTTLWAYRIAYKVSMLHTLYKLVYGLMPLLPIKFIIPPNQTLVEKDGSWMNALLVQMEVLVLLDGKRIIARENIDYIQILRKHKRDDEKHLNKFKDGNLVLWLPKDPKIKEKKLFFFLWTSSFQVKKAFNNNTIQLSTLSNEDIALVNVNKLRVYRDPIITPQSQ